MIQISINVKANKSIEKIIALATDNYEVHVNVPPVDGKANKRVIELLAKHLNISKSSLKIIRGEKTKNKVIEIS